MQREVARRKHCLSGSKASALALRNRGCSCPAEGVQLTKKKRTAIFNVGALVVLLHKVPNFQVQIELNRLLPVDSRTVFELHNPNDLKCLCWGAFCEATQSDLGASSNCSLQAAVSPSADSSPIDAGPIMRQTSRTSVILASSPMSMLYVTCLLNSHFNLRSASNIILT